MIDRLKPPHDVDALLDDVERLVTDGVARARAFPRRRTQAPAIDLYDTGTELVVRALVPGVRPENLDVSIEQNALVLQGTFGETLDGDEAKRVTWYRREIHPGDFSEVLALPVAVEADQVSAAFVDGVLNLRLPKIAQARSRKIPVRTVSPVEEGR